MKTPFPIDAVITWVDGDDPAHRSKRWKYMHGGEEARHDDIAGETRYRQIGEIAFCVASILRFAPFVRKIFIVTDNQNPKLDEFLSANFPNNQTNIELIDHKVIFRGYEQVLPTFNSLSIVPMLWRIPNLAEHFIYFNDDIMLLSPTKPSDFFDKNGNPLCYGNQWPMWWAKMLRTLKPKHKGRRAFGFKDAQLNAQQIAGPSNTFLYMAHTPHNVIRSFFETFFAEHPDILLEQIKHRFRDESQFSAVCLQYAALHAQGRCSIISPREKLLYIKPKKGKERYMERKIRKLEQSQKTIFCCANSLDEASENQQHIFREALSQRLRLQWN